MVCKIALMWRRLEIHYPMSPYPSRYADDEPSPRAILHIKLAFCDDSPLFIRLGTILLVLGGFATTSCSLLCYVYPFLAGDDDFLEYPAPLDGIAFDLDEVHFEKLLLLFALPVVILAHVFHALAFVTLLE